LIVGGSRRLEHSVIVAAIPLAGSTTTLVLALLTLGFLPRTRSRRAGSAAAQRP
jgi:hypothetical protein